MSDPIVGIATAAGEGGIAIVRISGDGAADLFQQVFRPAGKRRPPYESHRLMYGHAMDGDEMIDECMGVVMYAPHTYTREDVCELHTHGGRVAAALVMKALIHLGARPAEAGEFTRRAFMNGRIDLSQAEAVMGVISAQSAAALRAQEAQLEGGPSRFIRQAQEDLTRLLAGLEAHIDYPDEIDEAEALDGLTGGLNALILRLESAVDERGARILREGLRVALCGRPNAGKSTLFNAFLGEDRAIVTSIPGLIGFIGHTLGDLSWGGSPWWSWVLASAMVGVIIGLVSKKIDLSSGRFGKKELLTFVLTTLVAMAISWIVVAPVLDIVIYAEPAKKVFAQGLVAGASNFVTTAVIGSLLMLAYTKTIAKSGSLKQE